MKYAPNIAKTVRNAGFTLLELSIVIIIISMIASAGLTLGIKRTEGSKKEITQQRMDKIEDAIGAFLIRNGCLPCPADGSLAVSNAGFGIGDAVAPCTACTTNVIATVPPISVGTVPIVDLQLSDEYMFDGWGRRFTYVIEPSFATAAGFSEANMGAWGTKNGSITVFARGDDSTSPPAHATQAVAVLLSHGDTGHGAWLKDGGANARFDSGSTDVAELENAHDEGDDTSFDNEFTMAERSATYDDMLQYWERWQIIKAAGGIVDEGACQIAFNTKSTYNNTATPKLGAVGCETGVSGTLNASCLIRQSELATKLLKLCFVTDPNP